MSKRYLFFVSVAYSYPILRPLQDAIRKRGDNVAWFVEKGVPILLEEREIHLKSIRDVREYAPIAVFAPGNYVYDFFPGVKVCLFHGYPINKRAEKVDDHFKIRGWFDMYCTQGMSSTEGFIPLEKKYGNFKVYETGWTKADTYYGMGQRKNSVPTVLYTSTFTDGISSTERLLPSIERICVERKWNWIVTFHPKYNNRDVIEAYHSLARSRDNVSLYEGPITKELLDKADVMLCDTSSAIVEGMLSGIPVVTFKNTLPGKHLVNVECETDLPNALEYAMSRPTELMDEIARFLSYHEGHFDGQSSIRVLDAVDDFIADHKDRMKPKQFNLVRKIKLRLKAKYYHW